MLYSELDWKINEETVVRPDFMIICGEIKKDYFEFSSYFNCRDYFSSSIKRDRVLKFDLYRE